MPLPEPSEQEGESVKAGQEPSPKPGTDVIPAAPRKPREFSKLVLLTASDQDEDGVGSKPQEVHCVLSLEMAGPATLASTLQILPVEEQGGVVQPALEMPEQKCSKLDAAAPQSLEFLRTPFGGRLLVLESFLYKQEKAVGDKVYWKCRQHAELGCRGRAITRGLRATVMRGHCHAPDEQGLEARRQREKLPSLALPEGLGEPQGPEGPGGRVEEPLEGVGPWQCPEEPEPTPGLVLSKPALEEEEAPRALSLLSLPPKKRSILGLGQARPLEFLRTCYGGSFLVHESFLYKREKAVGDKVYWTCRDHALHGCRSRAITQGQRVTVMRGHCHQPDMEGLEARRQQEKAVETLQAGQDGPGSQVDTLLRGVDSLLYRRGPGPLTLTRPRPRKRAKVEDQELPTQPEAPDEHQDMDADPGGPEFLKTPLGGSFLVYESFLYRREKAAGEKVYWTCRDQARMGCRSRAITQGRRVTVMRGHCHPPDLGGLEALRQREKRPNTAQRGSPGAGLSFQWLFRILQLLGHAPVLLCPSGSSCLPSLPAPHGPCPALSIPLEGGPEFLKTPLGGSFLVYESFLYRREKAAGEKVYWTCRDQARMGCRSRAITQGRRVMVMRRHCHPPDLGGLEALRQREHFPNLAQWDSPDPLRPLEFLRTSLGGRFLVHESFLYRKEKAAGEKVYWMCRDQARLGCRSRAITQGHRIMVMRSHCHQPDLAGLEALRQRERLPTTAQQEDPEKIQVQLCFKTCSPESQQIYGDIKDVRLDGESQ
ncbi:FLYWCH-type zinc finger-containing protein 1 isoform X6 [Homo sapiens]|uniref:Isoform 3 of FLYWCH-type zinc finger-containing protein 1 n=1 Tax=Homo sapiens TaxID=9606 RepID=Q4VC44-3|nr:FLYWCH-type zinc finger-containing protein 1 isoform X6 [Homo sapiens]XP_047290732.1 FLYWCH-type zinc finger-containing protein 1 isoform X6 [Homo sapiens]XP_054170141.1 FLYWCH-type zinc finger-containing protein 1 isoform X6 [Homo sapiens]XP_054170142.1 FLYWCH-type zinc finger-containing protein 1 isoform X6 [Homo sapiens]EAW85453.1 FLYWCH-type zinc finger 1, isoform CRA_c [Homo sapiens]|eukprot:XP_006721025.1 FLYWCH-type zinc finger-containing protein 1 isoform X4 [Homo sapiens]